MEILQTLRDAYTKSVISGQGDLTAAMNDAAAKVDTLAGSR